MKNAIGLFAAFCLALIVAIFVYFSQKSVEQKQQIVAHQAKTVMVLVATSDVLEGTRLELNRFEWKPWPASALQPDYFRKEDEKELKTLNGAVLRSSVSKGEPLKKADLIDIGTKSVVTAFVRPGLRGQVIPLNKVANPSAHFSPGDYVDVILPSSDNVNAQGQQKTIRGARIIAVDDKYSKEEDAEDKGAPKNITVEVTESQAAAIATAMQQGNVTLSMYSAFTPPSKSDVATSGDAPGGEKESEKDKRPPAEAPQTLSAPVETTAPGPDDVVILRGTMSAAGK